jgi:hypothetical protein
MEHNFGNVVSLFDGMSCTQIALQRMGIVPKRYFASEVDKYAITVAKANFPDTIHVGDVRNVIWPEIFDGEPIDLLVGGSVRVRDFHLQGVNWRLTIRAANCFLNLFVF